MDISVVTNVKIYLENDNRFVIFFNVGTSNFTLILIVREYKQGAKKSKLSHTLLEEDILLVLYLLRRKHLKGIKKC